MKKITKIIISIIVSTILILSSYFIYTFNEGNEGYIYSFYYNVEILNDPLCNSTVIVPLPDFYQNAQYWTDILLNNSFKEGNINVTVVNSVYGKGLLINSSEKAIINITLNQQVPADSLTMMTFINNRTFGCHYYTYNNSNNLVSIDVDFNNYRIINSINKVGHMFSAHIFPAPIGWYEYPGIHYEYFKS
ncbi:MAG: hypothetical protein KKH41_04180 [Candidatus Thermoplasmatota archaeon]|nr:hypothetical protein [Euryarchaeota archaeon]MBU4031500.1 hypothetical protein [Candidatus Thermoplasmatota archaeon]MBU4070879.1 hypothetical protein [Candidatus Thermoplasmatota archaeon]MBU4143579.1 hypothetical protein [Candidatus Thermoplasmatota archaeon]MBU4591766.1 hypothetical protein [Candidatus Thermoplasmatota archaeon]